MGKGKLKTTPLPIQVHRYTHLETIAESAQTTLGVRQLQPFFPPLEVLFKTNTLDTPAEYGLKLDEPIQSFLSPSEIRTSQGIRPIHIKATSILDSSKLMRGDYWDPSLPTTQSQASMTTAKIQSPNNASYVGALFASVFSQSKCVHFPKVYGVFSGLASSHTIDISDDYPELMEHAWFVQNIGKTFTLQLNDSLETGGAFTHTRSSRMPLELGESAELNDIPEMETSHEEQSEELPALTQIYQAHSDVHETDSDSSSVSTSYLFDVQSCDCSEKDDFLDEEDGDPYAWATFTDIPVQYTIMEQCESTLHELFAMNPELEKRMAWMAQIEFALLFVQNTFGFVHNDLHSNNVMCVSTDIPWLYYKVDDVMFRVPTYGKIMKLIDFERGIGSVRVAGTKEPKLFVSDHFAKNNEAYGQYNMDPFFTSKFPVVKPHVSVDAVHLATSLFWDIYPDGEDRDDPLYETLKRWAGPLLFDTINPKHERYHGFNLYKAIARLSKDTAILRNEIERLPYIIASIPPTEPFLELKT